MNVNHRLIVAIAAVVPALWACPQPQRQDPVVPSSAMVRSFTASPGNVAAAGDEVTLSWEVENAKSVAITTLDGAPVTIDDETQPQGSVQTRVDTSTVFVLTARGEGGNDTLAAAVVVPQKPQELVFTAFPQEVTAGQPVTLVWNAPFASEVSITDSTGTTVFTGAAQGSLTLSPAFSTTFTLHAADRTANAEISVSPAIVAFSSSAPSAEPGGPVTLHWNVGGASSVTLSAAGRGELVKLTTPADIAEGSFEDTAPTNLGTDSMIHYTLEAQNGNDVIQRELDVWVGTNPHVDSFEVPPFAKEGATFSVSWKITNAARVVLAQDGQALYQAQSAAEVAQGTLALPSPATGMTETIELRATSARGGVTTQTLQVSGVGVPSLVDFSADTNTVAHGGDPVTLSWNVPNARNLLIKDQDTGRVLYRIQGMAAEAGSFQHYPNRLTHYVLEADNTVGDVLPPTPALAVDVTTPAQLVFSPPTAPEGGTVQITGTTAPGSGAIIGLPIWNAPGEQFVDISGNGTSINYSGPDTTGKLVTLPETFNTVIYGVPVSGNQISININGWFKFASTSFSGYDSPSPFPTTALEPLAIAPLWADLYDNATSEIYYRLDTVATDRRLIVQWNRVEYDPVTNSEVTVEAQVFSSGKIVFAYKTLQGFTKPVFSIGVVNADETDAVFTTAQPQEGDTLTFFEKALPPVATRVSSKPFTVMVDMAGGTAQLEITTTYPIIPAGQFYISEANYNPAPGKSEWFEVTNLTAQALDLAGWTIDFGGGVTHVISGPLILPANGRLLFGQNSDAAEASAGGPAVDYVYGPAYGMPDSSGGIALTSASVRYAELSWTSAGTQGTAIQNDPPRNMLLASGATVTTSCPATGTYGSGGQHGTPGATNASFCNLYWSVQSIPGAFVAIAGTGHAITGLTSTGNNSLDATNKPLDFTAAGGHPITIGGITYGDSVNPLHVDSNGYVALSGTTSSNANPSLPDTGAPNGVLAVFWDDLAGNTSTASAPSGVYWNQFDPDSTPGSGDEYTLISWENWKQWFANPSNLNFQIKIYEGTGVIEYHYGTINIANTSYSDGKSATVWIESIDGTYATAASVNQPNITSNTGFRFTPLTP